MKRIDYRTVELHDREQWAKDEFEACLDRGHSVEFAVEFVRNIFPDLLNEFYAWLGK
jgi:hypothetical protein